MIFRKKLTKLCGSVLCQRHIRPITDFSSANIIIDYLQTSNYTKAMQFFIEGFHDFGFPWASSFIVSGIALRIMTLPAHIYAEKLLMRRLHATSALRENILKKLSVHYKVGITSDSEGRSIRLNTSDERISKKSSELVNKYTALYLGQNHLTGSRIYNLRLSTFPFWVFCSCAIRNIMFGDIISAHPEVMTVSGAMWFTDLTIPDPYFIIPIALAVTTIFNFWCRQQLMPIALNKKTQRMSEILAVSTTILLTGVMTQLPVILPLYWLTISLTAIAETILLQHPALRKLFGIQLFKTSHKTFLKDVLCRFRNT